MKESFEKSRKKLLYPCFLILLIIVIGTIIPYLLGATDTMLFQIIYFWIVLPLFIIMTSFICGKKYGETPELSAAMTAAFLVSLPFQLNQVIVDGLGYTFVYFALSVIANHLGVRKKKNTDV